MLYAEIAGKLVSLALAGIEREYPYKMGNVLQSAADLISPRETHAVFNGHFDWHSSVHGHWTLVKLLRLFPNEPWSAKVQAILENRLTTDGLASEAVFLKKNPAFERMYGWAWGLKLGMELRLLGGEWQQRFEPMEEAIVANALAYLPKLDWPIRCGFHPESSFAMSQMLDWARMTNHAELEQLVLEKAQSFYANDINYPTNYEPSGNDFFSAGLNTADLMRRVYPKDEFITWLDRFLPTLKDGMLGSWLSPVMVSDLEDGHIVHLVGLNLSRAWCMYGIGNVLDPGDQRRAYLLESARLHLEAGLEGVWSGSYEGEHWLGSFACYAMSDLSYNFIDL